MTKSHEFTVSGVFTPKHQEEKAEQLASLCGNIYEHKISAHKHARKIVEQSRTLCNVDEHQKRFQPMTAKLTITAYSLAKNNQPCVASTELCDLQETNGLNRRVGLHSRYSASVIITNATRAHA